MLKDYSKPNVGNKGGGVNVDVEPFAGVDVGVTVEVSVGTNVGVVVRSSSDVADGVCVGVGIIAVELVL
jgi:hypothetical protein